MHRAYYRAVQIKYFNYGHQYNRDGSTMDKAWMKLFLNQK